LGLHHGHELFIGLWVLLPNGFKLLLHGLLIEFLWCSKWHIIERSHLVVSCKCSFQFAQQGHDRILVIDEFCSQFILVVSCVMCYLPAASSNSSLSSSG
jgi:hypothetical protein